MRFYAGRGGPMLITRSRTRRLCESAIDGIKRAKNRLAELEGSSLPCHFATAVDPRNEFPFAPDFTPEICALHEVLGGSTLSLGRSALVAIKGVGLDIAIADAGRGEHRIKMQLFPIVQALVLLMLANGTPVIAKKTFGSRLALPLDAGLQFVDGQPLFGTSKTIRGILSSIVVTAGLAPLLWMSVGTGALIAGFAMIGDLFSSFLKRRLKFPPSSKAIGLDQIPESLFPL